MNRVEWVLGGLLVVLLAAVIVLGLLFWLQPGVGEAPPLPTTLAPTAELQGVTALTGFAQARQAARSWQADAQLVTATATWPVSRDAALLSAGQENWRFSFYSPGADAANTVTVVNGNATVLGERPISTLIEARDASGWRVDSDEAIEKMLDAGGDSFLRNYGSANLTVALDTTAGDGIVWNVALVINQARRSLTATIDATSGTVLDVQEVPPAG